MLATLFIKLEIYFAYPCRGKVVAAAEKQDSAGKPNWNSSIQTECEISRKMEYKRPLGYVNTLC